MNITEAYKILTSANMTYSSRQGIIAELEDYLASDRFSPAHTLTDRTRSHRVLAMGLTPIEKFQDFVDPELSVLLCHGMLMRLSCRMHESQKLIKYIPSLFRANLPHETKRVGTLLGYAIGYTVGQGMYLGHDMSGMSQVFSEDRFIARRERFYQGIITGYQSKGISVIHDKQYREGLKERYDGWSETHFTQCMDILKNHEQIHTPSLPTINQHNERLTWLFQCMCCDNPFFTQLHADHTAKVASYAQEEALQDTLGNLLGDDMIETNEKELIEIEITLKDMNAIFSSQGLSNTDRIVTQTKMAQEEAERKLIQMDIELTQKMQIEQVKYDMLKGTEKETKKDIEKPVKTNYSQYL